MKIVEVDAGHGGFDPGAVGNGLVEKDLALRIAKGVRDGLKSKYIVDVRMTRDNDTFVELSERARMANRIDADLFVSFHHNAAGGTGFETFVYPGNRNNVTGRMQDLIHDELMNFYGLGVRDRGKKEANFAVLRETSMPAVLIENLFVDHPKDAALLKRADVIDGIINATVLGIAKALSLPRKEQLPSVQRPGTVVVGDQKQDAYFINDLLYVPVRFVSEALGANVDYVNATKTAKITK